MEAKPSLPVRQRLPESRPGDPERLAAANTFSRMLVTINTVKNAICFPASRMPSSIPAVKIFSFAFLPLQTHAGSGINLFCTGSKMDLFAAYFQNMNQTHNISAKQIPNFRTQSFFLTLQHPMRECQPHSRIGNFFASVYLNAPALF